MTTCSSNNRRIWLASTLLLVAVMTTTNAFAQDGVVSDPSAQTVVQISIADLLQQINQATMSAQTAADYSALITMCEQALQSEATKVQQKYVRDTSSWAYNRRGQLIVETEPAAALSDFETAVQLNPAAWRARYNRAISLAQVGKLAEAQADLDRVIQADPGNYKAHFNRGEVKFARGDAARAISDYDAALRIDPKSVAAYNARGFANFRTGRHSQALNDFGRAISLDAKNVTAYVNRGDVLAETGQYGRATQDYKQAIDLDPRASQAYLSWAWLMATCPNQQFRNSETAVSYARYANREFGTDHYRYLDVLAAALANDGQFEEARKVQEKALDLTPDDEKKAVQARLDQYALGQAFRTPATVIRAQSP